MQSYTCSVITHAACRVSPMATLGWQKAQRSYVPLHCIQPEGGSIASTLLVVQRKYPVMVWERLPSGVTVTVSLPTYEAAQSQYENQAAKVTPTHFQSITHSCRSCVALALPDFVIRNAHCSECWSKGTHCSGERLVGPQTHV